MTRILCSLLLSVDSGAASKAASDTAEKTSSWWNFDSIDITCAAVSVAVVAGVIYFAYRQISEFSSSGFDTGSAEEKFEASVLAERGLAPEPPAAVDLSAPEPPPVPQEVHRPWSPTGDIREFGEAPDLESLAKKLTVLGVVTLSEGRFKLPNGTEGMMYRLQRGGGLCLVLPFQADSLVLANLSRRFDLLIMRTEAGEVVVAERFQHRLPELIE